MSTFEEAFEETGHGTFNHIVLLTSGLVLLYVMMESLGVGYVIAFAECDLSLTPAQKGMVNAAVFIGIFLMAFMWGYMSDRFGRRAVMIPAISASTLVSFCSSLSGDFGTLFLLRMLTGCLVSASSATVYAYLSEMHTIRHRASAIAYGSTFIAITFIVLSILAYAILPGKWSFHLGRIRIVPWRVFIWSWCTPGLLAVAILSFLPESPRYLYAVKGQIMALPVLAKIYAWNNRNKKEDDFPIKSIKLITAATLQRGFKFSNIGQLLRAPLRRCVLISHFSMFMVFLLSSGLYTWMPFIFNEMLNHIDEPITLCAMMKERYRQREHNGQPKSCQMEPMNSLVYLVVAIVGMVCSVTYIVVGHTMSPKNKILIYCSVLVVSSLMCLLCAVVPQPVVAIIVFIIGLSSGVAASVLAAIAVEVFPTSVRAVGLCTLYMLGRTGAAAGANIVGWGLWQNCYLVFCLNCLVTAGSTLLLRLWPDPKDVRAIMEGRGFVY